MSTLHLLVEAVVPVFHGFVRYLLAYQVPEAVVHVCPVFVALVADSACEPVEGVVRVGYNNVPSAFQRITMVSPKQIQHAPQVTNRLLGYQASINVPILRVWTTVISR